VKKYPGLISPLAIAPMIDWTYTHFRVFMRMLAPKALLYTDMQTIGAVFNNPGRALQFQDMENPIALQLGGADVSSLVRCAILAEEKGFDEINLNLGCPSDRVQAGCFGACMMNEPDLVVDCIEAMKRAVSIPVTAKTRIGIDKQDSYDFFSEFGSRLVTAGVDKIVVHARKAWLKGLNPKQNRTIPPVNYDYVYRFKQQFKDLPVVINGNINSLSEITHHLNLVDGVMLGRLACNNPYQIAVIHNQLFPGIPLVSRADVLSRYFTYAIAQQQIGVPVSLLLKPVLGMAHGLAGAKQWKETVLMAQRAGIISALPQACELIAEMEQ
jgi:tRNA-dihydrouridine synthase A